MKYVIIIGTAALACAFIIGVLAALILFAYWHPDMLGLLILFVIAVGVMSWAQDANAAREWRIGMGYEVEDPKHVAFRKRHGIKAWYDKEDE